MPPQDQIIMVSLVDLVPEDHVYRKFCKIWKFERAKKRLKSIETDRNYKGYGVNSILAPAKIPQIDFGEVR